MAETLILNQKCAHTFSFYDLVSGREVHRLRLPDFPHEFVIDSKGRYAYVGHYGIETHAHHGEGGCSIFVIDLKTGAHVRTLDTYPYRKIHGLAMDSQDRLYALSEGSSVLMIFDDPTACDTPNRALPSGGYKSHLVAVTQDGEQAFCLNLMSNTTTYLRPQDPTFAPVPIIPGKMPEGNCLSVDESVFFVTNRASETVVAIDVRTLKVTRSARTLTDPTRVYQDPTGRLFVTNYGEQAISVFDENLNDLGILRLDARPIAMSFHPTQPLGYVSLKSDEMGVVDLETLRIIRTFPTLQEPDVSKVVNF